MYVISISAPPNASIIDEEGKAPPEMSANTLACYKITMSREDGVRKCLSPSNSDTRAKNRTSRDLRIFANSEYVDATFPIALSLFWGKRCWGVAYSKPLSTVFTILTHCLYTKAANNYFAKTDGQWFCLDAVIDGLSIWRL